MPDILSFSYFTTEFGKVVGKSDHTNLDFSGDCGSGVQKSKIVSWPIELKVGVLGSSGAF